MAAYAEGISGTVRDLRRSTAGRMDDDADRSARDDGAFVRRRQRAAEFDRGRSQAWCVGRRYCVLDWPRDRRFLLESPDYAALSWGQAAKISVSLSLGQASIGQRFGPDRNLAIR